LAAGSADETEGFYRQAVREGRGVMQYLVDVDGPVMGWIIEANGRAPAVLAAEMAARRATRFDPSQDAGANVDPDTGRKLPGHLDRVDHPEAAAYYARLKEELEARGSPEAAALRDAAEHTAWLLYKAWVDAGKPLALQPPPEEPEAAPDLTTFYLVLVAAAVLAILVRLRRAPPARPPRS
jgi:hypothetical protein